MSPSDRRITQRAPQSCAECTRRKLRCSKIIPCSSCIERGMRDRCHREVVTLSRESRTPKRLRKLETALLHSKNLNIGAPHGSFASFSAVGSEELRSPSGGALRGGAAQNLLPGPTDWSPRSSPNIHPQGTTPGDRGSISLSPATHSPEWDDSGESAASSPAGQGESELAIEAAMSLESLAWGSHRDQESSGFSQVALRILDELHGLVSAKKCWEIIKFHQKSVAWMHNVLYMPFFVRRCEAYLSGRLHQDLAWLSLYLAVLCTGVYYMKPEEIDNVGLHDGYSLAKALYAYTLEMMKESDFMGVQSLHSVQAICVLLLCSHSLGDGKRTKALLSCANSIAQDVPYRLHVQPPTSGEGRPFEQLVDQEVRRRIWCFLCTQDWYLIDSKKSYSINPAHGTTPLPSNCREDFDDATAEGHFEDLPLSIPTQTTYMLCLFKLTSQFRVLHDRLCGADIDINATAATFDTVLDADTASEELMNEFVQSALTVANTGFLSSEVLLSQKKALIIASWHQRLKIHRSFFCRSFRDKKYHYSRFISLAAARGILRCYLEIPSDATTDIWTVPAHAISACFIITLNSVFSTEQTTVEQSDMELMHQCVLLLKALQRPSAIVERGLIIVDNLLNQSPRQRFRKLDPGEISRLAEKVGENSRPVLSKPSVAAASTNGGWDEDDFCLSYLNDLIYQEQNIAQQQPLE